MPGQRDQEDHDNGHQRPLGRAAHQGLRDTRRSHRTGRRPAQESNNAQGTDDETLPVTLHGERGGEHNQDHIEQVTRHILTVSGKSPRPPLFRVIPLRRATGASGRPAAP